MTKKLPAKPAPKRKTKGGGKTAAGPAEPAADQASDTRARDEEDFGPAYDGEPKFTPAVAAKIVAVVARGNFRDTAAATVGISARTLRKWLHAGANGNKKYERFVADLDAAESGAEDLLVVAISQQAKADWRAAAWLLERRGSKRWGFKAQVEFTVDEALADMLDVAASVLGGESASKLFTALASRGGGAEEARRVPSPAGGGGGAPTPGSGSSRGGRVH